MLKLFNNNIFDASNLVALFCWAISTLLSLLLYPENIILTWLFLLFFLIRSRGAYYQLIAFCEHRYFDVLLSGFFIVMTAMLLLILAGFLSWLYLKCFKTNEVRQISKPVLPEIFYNWFYYFKFAEAPAKIYSLSFIPNNLENFRKILQIKLSKKLSNSGKVSALDKNQFLYFTTRIFLEDQIPNKPTFSP